MDILVGTAAHNQHVQQMVRALYEADALHSYVTGGVDSFRNPLLRAARGLVARHLPQVSRQLARRSIEGLPADRVFGHWGWEAPRVVASHLRAARLEDWIWDRGERALDRHCARALRDPKVEAFLGVEYGALASLREAAAHGKPGIVAFLSPHHKTRAAWVDREYATHPELDTRERTAIDRLRPIRDRRCDDEAAAASWIVTGSSFTTRSLVAAGIAPAKILTVPLGGPDPMSVDQLPRRANSSPHFVYVGPVSVRKGAHYLLRAWRRVAAAGAELHFYGKTLLPDEVIAEARRAPGGDRIVFHGSIPSSELPAAYRQATALVFPTLCDGFGMVVSEALANGLPVITTCNAGAADAIVNGRSGLLIPAADVDAIAEAIDWSMAHPAEVYAMRREALETAARRTWTDFRSNFRAALGGVLRLSAPIRSHA